MGFRIGRAFRSIGRAFSRVTSFAKKALDFVKKPLSEITKPFQGVIGKVLDKLPFGNVIKGFMDKFMDKPLNLLLAPVLGPLGGILEKIGGLGDLLKVGNQMKGTEAFQNPDGRQNALQMFAAQTAKIFFG